jgi:hypothetical protein
MSNSGPSVPPGLDPDQDEVGGAYVTVSQQASQPRRGDAAAHAPTSRWDSR